MNIVEVLLINGFKSSRTVRTNDNWMGISVYHPDLRLVRGDKMVVLSLNGITCPTPNNPSEKWLSISESGSLKYICFYIGEDKKYETYFGEIPPEKFITDFIK